MIVLLTGGASGLGKAINLLLAKEQGVSIYFTYNKSREEAEAIVEKYKNTYAIKCDFSNRHEVDNLISKVAEINPDVLINNAIHAAPARKHFHKCDIGLFESNFANNIVPTIRLTQETISLFRKKKSGRIITILTSYVDELPIGMSEYVASKSYLLALSNVWAKENASFNIASNCVSPSMMQTNLVEGLDERLIEDVIKSEPLKRLISVDEVADTVKFLVSASLFMNGENIILNGGK